MIPEFNFNSLNNCIDFIKKNLTPDEAKIIVSAIYLEDDNDTNIISPFYNEIYKSEKDESEILNKYKELDERYESLVFIKISLIIILIPVKGLDKKKRSKELFELYIDISTYLDLEERDIPTQKNKDISFSMEEITEFNLLLNGSKKSDWTLSNILLLAIFLILLFIIILITWRS